MRILYLITRSEHGGAQSHLLQLVGAVSQHHHVMVATGEPGQLCDRLRNLGVEVVVLRHLKYRPNPWQDAAALFELSSVIRRWKPDLLHAHSAKAGVIGRLSAAMNAVPSVYTAHGFAFAGGSPMSRKLLAMFGEWLAARAGDFTIAVSRSECRLAMQYRIVHPRKTSVIYNGVAESRHRAVPELSPPVIAMVARFAYPKQQELLIRAFARIVGNARLWFIGDGPEQARAKQLARATGMSERIVFWGDQNDIPALLAQVQVAALISRHEGFGLSLVEAMSAGLPVIASDTGGIAEVVAHGRTGLLVPPDNEVRLAEGLDRLIADPGSRKAMGNAGLARYRAEFSASRMIERTLGVYEAALDSSCDERAAGCCSACRFPHACESQFAISSD